jgi:hypothetical protein
MYELLDALEEGGSVSYRQSRRIPSPTPKAVSPCSSCLNPEYDACDVLDAWYADHVRSRIGMAG